MEWDSSSDSLARRKLGPSWVTFLIERGEPMIDPRVPRKSDKQPGSNSYSPNSNPVKTFKQNATERSNSWAQLGGTGCQHMAILRDHHVAERRRNKAPVWFWAWRMLSWSLENWTGILLDVEHFPSIQPNAAFTKLDSAVSKCTSRQAYISAANKHPQTPLKAGVGQNWRDVLRAKPKLQRVLSTPLETFINFFVFSLVN